MDSSRLLEIARDIQLLDSTQLGPVYFHGETMRPFLGEGDLLIIEPVEWDDIQPGDIITYRDQHKYPTRRVLSVNRRKNVLHIRCDNLPHWDDLIVPRSEVLGKAVARQRDGIWIYPSDAEWQTQAQYILKRDCFTHLRFRLGWLNPRRYFRSLMKPSPNG